MAAEDTKWYYNPETGEVAQGLVFDALTRMGPYDSEQEARDAVKIAQERAAAADAYDEESEDWGEKPSWEK